MSSNQINTNNYSLNAQRNLANNQRGLASALERLSSGLRVNSARDDATGLASGMKLESDSRITIVQIRQEADTISANQIWDNAMSVVANIQIRLNELAQMGGANSSGIEASTLVTQAGTIQTDALAKIATFGTTASYMASVAVTSGTVSSAGLTSIANQRTSAGAAMNNAEFKIEAYRAQYEGQKAAQSRIMDADFAEETSKLSRFQVLTQAGTAMVAQANAVPQNVLALLR